MPAAYRDMPNLIDDSMGKVVGKDGGMKNDEGKLDWWLFPFDAFEGVVKILMYGAKKYEEENWKNVKNRRNFAALIRHLIKWKCGEEFDPESGLHHLDHALCDLMFIVYNLKAR